VGLVEVALWHGVLQLDDNNAQASGNKRPLSESLVLEPVLGTIPCSPDSLFGLQLLSLFQWIRLDCRSAHTHL
jgi:hypothetical protein